MHQYEAKFLNDANWYELTDGPRSHEEAAQVFAAFMIDQEWRRYDLRHAEMLAKEQIVVRDSDGTDPRLFRVAKVKLGLNVTTSPIE